MTVRVATTVTIVLFLTADREKAHSNLRLSFNEVITIELSLHGSVNVIELPIYNYN